MSVRFGLCCAALGLYLAAAAAGCKSAPAALASAAAPQPPIPAAAAPQPLAAQPIAAQPLPAQPLTLETSTPSAATPAAFQQPAQEFVLAVDPVTSGSNGPTQLVLHDFVEDVLGRNQSLQAMTAAWQAAAQRYPQAIALDDPMFNSMTAPASWRSSQVTPAYIVGGSQKIPWMGKRPLRGQMAQSEANAAFMDVSDARLQLVQAAQLAFFDYYLVNRLLELNAANAGRLQEFRDTARRQYEANLAVQQDVLQSEVELADLARRQVELERMRKVAIARINTLLHRAPDAFIPPPPASLPIAGAPPAAESLRQTAIRTRPDLAAIAARIQTEQAALRLAYKEFLPDFEVFGRYDSFWQPDSQRDLRSQVGVNMDVPIYLDKRRAAAREAMFKLSQKQAEYQQRIDDINNEVQSAYERVIELRQVVDLYAQRTLPAARQNVESARADYIAGKGDFLRLISAQRQLIGLQERHQEAIADYHSRLADLERAVGGPIGAGQLQRTIEPGT